MCFNCLRNMSSIIFLSLFHYLSVYTKNEYVMSHYILFVSNLTSIVTFSSFGFFCLFVFFNTLVYFWFNAVDCLDPTCSNNGICVNGECHCKPGWGGLHCELPRAQCPDQCHGHGAFIPDTGLCSCDPNWMGPDCSMGR